MSVIKNVNKGFTLIELLIVIAILAVLAATVTVVLNPTEILAQARDTQRIGDLDAINNAIAFRAANEPALAFAGMVRSTVATSTLNIQTGWSATSTVSTSTAIDGTGWLGSDVNFTNVAGMSAPISKLPIDPTNSGFYGYMFKTWAPTGTYELAARLESQKFRGKMAADGGNSNTCTSFTEATCWYEEGTGLAI